MTNSSDAGRNIRRLDEELVRRGLSATRSRARDLVVRGAVVVSGTRETRPAKRVSPSCMIEIAADAGAAYVSRGAVKLLAALDAFGCDPAGRIALDVGASTGGFTDVLLERGAAHVIAADVGSGQLHAKLRAEPRVTCLEQTDARDLKVDRLPAPVGMITVDVSFISLTKVLPVVMALAAPGCWLVALIKPQYEAGRAAVAKGGIVRNSEHRDRAVTSVVQCIAAQRGWTLVGTVSSPILGGDGNEETLIGARRDV